MAPKQLPETLCREAWEAVAAAGTLADAARAMGVSRQTLEHRYHEGRRRFGWDDVLRSAFAATAYDPEAPPQSALAVTMDLVDATVVAFSDAHWTTLEQPRALAHEALLRAIPDIKPTMLLSMGDLLDFGEPSRHPPLMWQPRIKVKDELAACRRHLADMRERAPNAVTHWVRGNHDDRFDKWLAAQAGSFEGVDGFSLADHFSDWPMSWRLNLPGLMAVHRYHGGMHAAWNNTVKSGISVLSGDTHSLEVKPYRDETGRRYGVQTGMLGDPVWPCFSYTLGITRLWSPGFAVLTWRGGKLMPPELCEVVDGVAWFRGETLAGKPRYRVKAVAA
jgi:hypothetical protein